jgi:hypothetical protein
MNKKCSTCVDLFAEYDKEKCENCGRVLLMREGRNEYGTPELWICVTTDKHYNMHIIKIVNSYNAYKKWRHNRVDRIIEMEKLQAKYYLRIDSKRVNSKYFSAWSKFAEKYNLFMYEERSNPYGWKMTIDEELKVDKND